MRFLPREHHDLIQLLTDARIGPHEVLFVKRHGRLHVQVPGRSDEFNFFRERSVHLDAEGQWQKGETYYVGTMARSGEGMDWSQVLQAFRQWLATS